MSEEPTGPKGLWRSLQQTGSPKHNNICEDWNRRTPSPLRSIGLPTGTPQLTSNLDGNNEPSASAPLSAGTFSCLHVWDRWVRRFLRECPSPALGESPQQYKNLFGCITKTRLFYSIDTLIIMNYYYYYYYYYMIILLLIVQQFFFHSKTTTRLFYFSLSSGLGPEFSLFIWLSY